MGSKFSSREMFFELWLKRAVWEIFWWHNQPTTKITLTLISAVADLSGRQVGRELGVGAKTPRVQWEGRKRAVGGRESWGGGSWGILEDLRGSWRILGDLGGSLVLGVGEEEGWQGEGLERGHMRLEGNRSPAMSHHSDDGMLGNPGKAMMEWKRMVGERKTQRDQDVKDGESKKGV